MGTFRETRLEDIAPIRWMGRLVEGIAEALGQRQDDELQVLKDAVSMRVPTHCPDDALPMLRVNFHLPAFLGETAAQLRARLLEAFPTWEEAGLPQAIMRSLHAFGVADVAVYNWADWPTPDEWFSKFWVVIGPDMPWEEQEWGAFDWGDPSTWGSTATLLEIAAVLGQVIFWKSPQSLPMAVILNFGDGMVWGVDEWGENVWGGQTVWWPMANMWGEPWVKWGAFKWGNGKWVTGEIKSPF